MNAPNFLIFFFFVKADVDFRIHYMQDALLLRHSLTAIAAVKPAPLPLPSSASIRRNYN